MISGVQINFDPTLLSNDWSLCYNGTYDLALNLNSNTSVLNICNKGKLMLGCRPTGSSLLAVAAMGLRTDVLYNCGTVQNCTHVADCVGWYYSDSYSWGFVNHTDSVVRNSCDTSSTNSAFRLCWHTPAASGYRCGSNVTYATNYERVIYHAN